MADTTEPPSAAEAFTIRVLPTDAEYGRGLRRYWLGLNRRKLVIKFVVLTFAAFVTPKLQSPVLLAVLWTALGTSTLRYVQAYLRYRRTNLRSLRIYENEPTTLTFSDAGLAISSAIGEASVRWRFMDAIWEYGDMWLLVTTTTQLFIVPTRFLTPDQMAAIRRWTELGGRKRIACKQCGYDLRGQSEPRCPECGTTFNAAALRIQQ
jgi:hypothetical protein